MKGKIFYAPEKITRTDVKKSEVVFLAGTIEMGNSIDWQDYVSEYLADLGYMVLNPRRKDWDSTWEQSIDNPEFKKQVTWEIEGLQVHADYIIFNFLENSKSPITLLELGLASQSDTPCYIHCPKGYWRRGNVEVVADMFHMEMFDSLEEILAKFERIEHFYEPLDSSKIYYD